MEFAKQLLANPLFRRSLRRIWWKTKRFLWNILPDVLVIGGSVFALMKIWELCFWG